MAIYLIALASMFLHTAYGGSRVLISLLAIDLGAGPLRVGVLAALYAVCPMLFAIYTGKLIDRVGALAPMLIGSAGIVICLLLTAAFPQMGVLYSVAPLLGLSSMLFFVAVQGVTGAVGREADRAKNYGVLSVGFSLAGFLGPLIAGFSIDGLGHRRALLILATCAVVPLLLLWLKRGLIPRPAPADDRKSGQTVLDLLRIPGLRSTFLISGALSAAWDLYSFYMPVYGTSIGLSASAIGMILSVFALATVLVRFFLSTLVRHGSEMRILNQAIYVASTAFFLFSFFENPWALAAISFLLGLGVGTGQPLSMNLIYNLAPRHRTSEAAGVRVTFNHCTHVTIPLVFGGIGAAFGFAPVFVGTAMLLFSGALINHRSAKR